MPDVGSRMPDAGCRMPDAGCRMPDAGCRMPDAGCRMPDAGVLRGGRGQAGPATSLRHGAAARLLRHVMATMTSDGRLTVAPGAAGHLRSPRAWLRAAPEPGRR